LAVAPNSESANVAGSKAVGARGGQVHELGVGGRDATGARLQRLRCDRVVVAPGRDVVGAAAYVVARNAAADAAQVDRPQANTERTAESVVGDDDPRFDQDLAHRNVDLGDQRLDFLELRRNVGDEELVRAGLEHDGTAWRKDARRVAGGPAAARALPGQTVRDVLHLRVVELERLRAHRLERRDLLLRLQLDLFLGVELVLGGDQDDVARLAQTQVLRLQDDVERLVPGHVLQAQRDVAGHRYRWSRR
jgi:hypothetical protein